MDRSVVRVFGEREVRIRQFDDRDVVRQRRIAGKQRLQPGDHGIDLAPDPAEMAQIAKLRAVVPELHAVGSTHGGGLGRVYQAGRVSAHGPATSQL